MEKIDRKLCNDLFSFFQSKPKEIASAGEMLTTVIQGSMIPNLKHLDRPLRITLAAHLQLFASNVRAVVETVELAAKAIQDFNEAQTKETDGPK